jgi:hypothetical protein
LTYYKSDGAQNIDACKVKDFKLYPEDGTSDSPSSTEYAGN